MLKSFYIPLLASILLISCGENTSPKTELIASLNVQDIEQLQAEFVNCKEASSEAHACKEFVSKCIATYYGYEFKGANEMFLPYDKLLDVVTASTAWEEVGNADDQAVLTKAQQNANEGIPTLALNTKGSKTVAIVINGTLSHSNSLGLDCPAVAVFRPKRYNKSFVGKGINYAWSNLEEVKIYSLK